MHVTGHLLFFCGVLVSGLVQNNVTLNDAPKIGENISESTPAPVNCKTVRNETGSCTTREHCDLGDGAIDFTIYLPHWYKRPCDGGQVCCPLGMIVLKTQSINMADYDFDFDDDDDY